MRSGMGWVVALLIGSAVVWMLARAGSDQGRRKVMVVDGFELPAAFVQLYEAIQRGDAPTDWELKIDVDAYGHPWQVADLRIDQDREEMQYFTERIREIFLDKDFPPDDDLEDLLRDAGVTERSAGLANFVFFAHATDGRDYFFDFGTDPKEPSIVSMHEGSWERAAPNFRIFMALFVPSGGDRDLSQKMVPLQPSDEAWKAAQPTPRDLLARWALEWVVTPHLAVLFESLASYYAACSEEERREVEAEVREELVRRGMTNRQRRKHDGLWERLRASLANDEDDEEDEEVTPPTGRLFLESNVPYYVLDMPPGAASDPSVFSQLVSAWAEITPEERQEVEEEVRESLKFQDMTDEHRRRLEEVWERLRASLPS
jgi:hypothetical protein